LLGFDAELSGQIGEDFDPTFWRSFSQHVG
jgi:hypothetical protein